MRGPKIERARLENAICEWARSKNCPASKQVARELRGAFADYNIRGSWEFYAGAIHLARWVFLDSKRARNYKLRRLEIA